MRKEIRKEDVLNLLKVNLKLPFSKKLIFKHFWDDLKRSFRKTPFIDANDVADGMYCILDGRMVCLHFSDSHISIEMSTNEMSTKIEDVVLIFEKEYKLNIALRDILNNLFTYDSAMLTGEERETAMELLNTYTDIEKDRESKIALSEGIIRARMKKELPDGPLLSFLTLYFEKNKD